MLNSPPEGRGTHFGVHHLHISGTLKGCQNKLSCSTWNQVKRRFLSLWFLGVSARWTWKLNLPNSHILRGFRLNLWDLTVLSRAFASHSSSSNPFQLHRPESLTQKILRKMPQSQSFSCHLARSWPSTHTLISPIWATFTGGPSSTVLCRQQRASRHLTRRQLETGMVPPQPLLPCRHLYLGHKVLAL